MVEQKRTEGNDVSLTYARIQHIAVMVKPFYAHIANRTMEDLLDASSATLSALFFRDRRSGRNPWVCVDHVSEDGVRNSQQQNGQCSALEGEFSHAGDHHVMHTYERRNKVVDVSHYVFETLAATLGERSKKYMCDTNYKLAMWSPFIIALVVILALIVACLLAACLILLCGGALFQSGALSLREVQIGKPASNHSRSRADVANAK